MQALSQLSYTPTKGAHYTEGAYLCKEWKIWDFQSRFPCSWCQIYSMDRRPSLESRPGAARRLVTFLARPRKVTERTPPLESRPVFTGCPCAACLDKAAAELDLAGHTKRALPWDSNSPRRKPLVESSCSARLQGRRTKRSRAKRTLLMTKSTAKLLARSQ